MKKKNNITDVLKGFDYPSASPVGRNNPHGRMKSKKKKNNKRK